MKFFLRSLHISQIIFSLKIKITLRLSLLL
nr:MAG TPA: hypothetical protein [Caudoviricetes sp.]